VGVPRGCPTSRRRYRATLHATARPATWLSVTRSVHAGGVCDAEPILQRKRAESGAPRCVSKGGEGRHPKRAGRTRRRRLRPCMQPPIHTACMHACIQLYLHVGTLRVRRMYALELYLLRVSTVCTMYCTCTSTYAQDPRSCAVLWSSVFNSETYERVLSGRTLA
jgi:hypothetical protein